MPFVLCKGHYSLERYFLKRVSKGLYNKVYVEITNICNMNCSFCHGHSRDLRQMSVEEFEYILDKLKGYTEYIYYHLILGPIIHQFKTTHRRRECIKWVGHH